MPRLMTDGNGNLLIDEEGHPDHGKPVAYHEGSFVRIDVDDPSHNERHHQKFATIDGTRDADAMLAALDAAGEFDEGIRQAYLDAKVNAGGGENMHHFETQEDDDHYDPDAPNKTAPKVLPDSLAPTVTGHTESWHSEEDN